MKLTVHFVSQGRMLEGSLYIPENSNTSLPTLLFENSMTGATSQVAEYLAREISQEGFSCLIMDHNYFGEEEGAPQPWESPNKRMEDIKAGLTFLSAHSAVDKDKIVGVGISVGAEFMAQVCRETQLCKGLVLVQGPFDDSQNVTRDLEIPTVVVDEARLESAVDEIVLWVHTLFGTQISKKQTGTSIDWGLLDK